MQMSIGLHSIGEVQSFSIRRASESSMHRGARTFPLITDRERLSMRGVVLVS